MRWGRSTGWIAFVASSCHRRSSRAVAGDRFAIEPHHAGGRSDRDAPLAGSTGRPRRSAGAPPIEMTPTKSPATGWGQARLPPIPGLLARRLHRADGRPLVHRAGPGREGSCRSRGRTGEAVAANDGIGMLDCLGPRVLRDAVEHHRLRRILLGRSFTGLPVRRLVEPNKI
jgi:hypothetical protein